MLNLVMPKNIRYIKMNFWNEKEAKRFHFIIHPLKNHELNILKTDLLHELSFYDELSIYGISKAFKRHSRT